MSDQPEHPPVPFTARRSDSDPDPGRLIYDANQELVGWADECEMAQFIVRACNSHEKLVEACSLALPYMRYASVARIVGKPIAPEEVSQANIAALEAALAAARHGEGHAVAGAEGGAS